MTKFLDPLLQPISKSQIIPLIEKTNVKDRTFLASMDVMSLDTNIPQNEAVLKLSLKHAFYRQPIPTHYLPEMVRLILKKNFFHFNGKHYLQTHGTAMGTKTAVSVPLPTFSWHILKQHL